MNKDELFSALDSISKITPDVVINAAGNKKEIKTVKSENLQNKEILLAVASRFNKKPVDYDEEIRIRNEFSRTHFVRSWDRHKNGRSEMVIIGNNDDDDDYIRWGNLGSQIASGFMKFTNGRLFSEDGKICYELVIHKEYSKSGEMTLIGDVKVVKYEFTGERKNVNGHTLYRIKRIYDGRIGGWIESEINLSHDDECWVDDNACVFGDAYVYDNAQVFGNAMVYGSAVIYDKAQVYENAVVCDNTCISGNAKVHGTANINGTSKISNDIEIIN